MINPPTYLFKYREVTERVLSMLSENQFYFANYKSFNDPFDCQVARHGNPPVPIDIAEREEPILRVCSLTAAPTSLLMWAHYANAHTGFCARYTIGADPKMRSMCFPVEYEVDFPLLESDMPQDIRKVLLTKSTDWAHEQEWRMISHVAEGSGESGMVYEHPSRLLSAIIFGMRMSDKDKDDIRRRLQSHPHVEFFVARRNSKSYSIDIVKDEATS